MSSTALGAGAEKAQELIFISEAHEKFYYEKLKEVRYQDVYHKALCYCLGISDDTRRNANRIYDFKTGCVKTECLHEGWQTSGSVKVVRMAFNLYCNGTHIATGIDMTPYIDAEGKLKDLAHCQQRFCSRHTVSLFPGTDRRVSDVHSFGGQLFGQFDLGELLIPSMV